ncbi:MAG: hypothetical protein ABI412_04430 [Sphingomicrobium sp.]
MRILVLLVPLALTGCVSIAKTAVDVATLPVKAVVKGVDLATTSQAEADENRGRAMRKAEEQYGKLLRAWEKECAAANKAGGQCPPRPEFVPPE